MSKRALVASGLAVSLAGLAIAFAAPASASTSCIASASGCRATVHHDMTHDGPAGIYSGDVICRRSTLC